MPTEAHPDEPTQVPGTDGFEEAPGDETPDAADTEEVGDSAPAPSFKASLEPREMPRLQGVKEEVLRPTPCRKSECC